MNNASTAATPATTPHAGRRSPSAYAAHAAHDERRHRGFHERGAVPHHERVIDGEQRAADERRAAVSATRARHSAARPSIMAASEEPDATGTVRACQVPTPKALNAAYSSAVNTGAMIHRIPVVRPPLAPERPIARVVHPRALVVPDDADRARDRRIRAQPERAQRQRPRRECR